MGKKMMSWKTRGMNQDLSVSAFNPEFSFENMNIRLSTNEGNTLMSWVNERGTERLKLHSEDNPSDEFTMYGVPIGTAVLNSHLVIFTVEKKTIMGIAMYTSYIYRLRQSNDKWLVKKLYSGNLGFRPDYPIETLVSYEAEHIQKVYWTDGKNQPRVINIANNAGIKENVDTQFDFVPEIALQSKENKLEGELKVEKRLSGGTFSQGIIQYCFTYVNNSSTL